MNRIVVSKEALNNNIAVIKNKLQNNNTTNPQIIAVLKANAYGIDAVQLGKVLLDSGISFFATANVEEAIALRKAGFTNDILVLNATCIQEELEAIVENDLIATIGSIAGITLLNTIALQKGKVARCHLKIDTGFCRFGFWYEEFILNQDFVTMLKETINSKENVKVEGTYTHFQEAYSNDSKRTKEQFERFMRSIQKLKDNDVPTGMLHVCNSSAFAKYPEMYLDAVRLGSAILGRMPIANTMGLQPVGYLESNVCAIKKVKAMERVGYSGLFQLKNDTTIGIVEAGFCDGVEVTRYDDKERLVDKLRLLKADVIRLFQKENRYVFIQDKPYRILGRVGMNNLMIDVTNSDVKVGDSVKINVRVMYVNASIGREYR